MRPELEYRITITGAAADTISYNRDWTHIYITSGTLSLAGAYSFDFSGGSLAEGDSIRIWCDLTNLDLNGNTCTIASVSIPQRILSAGKFYVDVRCYNDKGRGVLVTSLDYAGVIDDAALATDSVTTNKIADNAVTLAKIQDFTGRGYLMRGGAAGAPEFFKASTSGNILIGDGTDITSVPVSGDATISSAGVLTIGAGVIEESMLAFTLDSYLTASYTLSSTEILALNGTPITIIAAPGANKYIEIISATAYMNFDTAAYATNTTLQILCKNADVAILQNTSALISTVDKVVTFVAPTAATAGQTQIILNTEVQLKVATGNPTAGAGSCKVDVTYRIVTV